MDIASLKDATTQELFGFYDALLVELRRREIVRSSNNPAADYAEWLAAHALGLTLETRSTAGFDGIDSDGIKYEVKSRRRTPENDSVQLSQIRGLDQRHFDFLVGVIFRPDFSVEYAGKVPHEVVVELARFNEHTNASIFHFKPELLRDPRVTDITSALRHASSTTKEVPRAV